METDVGLRDVRALIEKTVSATAMNRLVSRCTDVCGGKMLRARLVLAVGPAAGVPAPILCRAGAAVEMLQSASLLHDDVVDGGLERRGAPAFWVSEGTKMAVLLGDMLVSAAVGLVQGILPDAIPLLMTLLQEMCNAVVEQELLIAGDKGTWEECISIARRKTGNLFGFAARCAAGGNADLSQALLRAGCDLGTAYQLADDLLDMRDDVAAPNKTLGSDRRGNKLTAAAFRFPGQLEPREHIKTLFDRASDELAAWPRVREAWDHYAAQALAPLILDYTGLDVMEAATP